MSAHRIQIEDERMETVKNWPEPKSVRDIQVFLGFANFYQRFIQGFSKIAGSLILILRISSLTDLSIILQSIDVADEEEVGETGSNSSNLSNPSASTRSTGVGYLTSGSAKTESSNIKKGVEAARSSDYLTPVTKKAFNHLWYTFTQAPILQYFDLERHLWIETDVSSYAIDKVLSQLTLDNLGQWYPVTYYSQKMILAKTQYKTHDSELLVIVEAFKTWRHYLKGGKHKVFVFTDQNSLRQFMDMKSLSFCQVC